MPEVVKIPAVARIYVKFSNGFAESEVFGPFESLRMDKEILYGINPHESINLAYCDWRTYDWILMLGENKGESYSSIAIDQENI